jgi:hypothetical protein
MMIRAGSNRSVPSAGRINPVDRPPIFPVLARAWRQLRKEFFDTYRPELHYMRGPGPKWGEKHGAPHATRCEVVVRTLRGATA